MTGHAVGTNCGPPSFPTPCHRPRPDARLARSPPSGSVAMVARPDRGHRVGPLQQHHHPMRDRPDRRAVDQGVTLIDTAEAYGPFISEEVVGEALQEYPRPGGRETKFGLNIDLQTGQRSAGTNSRPDHQAVCRGHAAAPAHRSYRPRLQHRVDPEVPIEDVAGAIKDLMAEGKVLHWGLSEPGRRPFAAPMRSNR